MKEILAVILTDSDFWGAIVGAIFATVGSIVVWRLDKRHELDAAERQRCLISVNTKQRIVSNLRVVRVSLLEIAKASVCIDEHEGMDFGVSMEFTDNYNMRLSPREVVHFFSEEMAQFSLVSESDVAFIPIGEFELLLQLERDVQRLRLLSRMLCLSEQLSHDVAKRHNLWYLLQDESMGATKRAETLLAKLGVHDATLTT